MNFNLIKIYVETGLKSILSDRALYITDYVFGTLTPFIVQFILWSAIYSSGSDTQEEARLILGFSYEQTLFYFAFSLLISRLNNGYDVILHLSSLIRKGSLDTFLIKPINYPIQRFYIYCGENILYIGPVLLLFCVWLYCSNMPITIFYPAGIVLLLVLSQILSFVLSFSLAVITFWTIDSGLILSTVLILSTLFGGVLLPPEFWPDWLVPIMKYNPFRYMIAAPAEFFVKPTLYLFFEAVCMSFFYISLFLVFIKNFWCKGLDRYVGAGG